MRRLFAFLLLLPLATHADDIRLSQEVRAADTAWMTSLGLKVPEGGLVLEQPFAAPMTRRSLIVPISWWDGKQPAEVSAGAFRQDVQLLHGIMQKSYGGWESAAHLGWDWDRWFADWDRELAAKGDGKLTLADALAPFERLERMQLDNHSGPTGGTLHFGSGSQTAVLESAPAGACTAVRNADGTVVELNAKDPAQFPKHAKIVRSGDGSTQDGFYLSYPARRGKASAVQCGGKWIPLITWGDSARSVAIAALAQKPEDQPSYRSVSDGIGYLRLPSFYKENNELLRKLLPTLPESAGHERLLIIDLRQNEGGDGPFGQMTKWVDFKPLQGVLRFSRVQPKSCVYDALRWGYTQITSQELRPPLSAGLTKTLQAQLDSLFQPVPDGCPVEIERQRSEWDYRQHRVVEAATGKPRLLLLTDSGCGSDCEGMVYLFSAIPGTVVVGESTYGVGQFIQPGYFILPHTRVRFRIATGMSDMYGDGRSFDGYGLGPDIVLAGEGMHLPATILRIAEQLAAR